MERVEERSRGKKDAGNQRRVKSIKEMWKKKRQMKLKERAGTQCPPTVTAVRNTPELPVIKRLCCHDQRHGC